MLIGETLAQNPAVNPKKFFSELKRRNVYKVAIAYIVGGWALAQGIAQVLPVFDAPNWVIRLLVVLIVIGFPIALIFAWAFEITPEGVKRAEDVGHVPQPPRKSHAWLYVVIVGALISISLFFLGRYTAQENFSFGRAPAKSIAVLPFENFSADKENAYFADGVQDDILTALAKVADLKVISRASVMSYAAGANRNLREIAQALGVSHVVEGSVRRSDGKVRVSAQLIDARNDAHLWADTYDRDLADVFAIQSDIAKAIVEQLRAKLSRSEKAAIEERPTNDITAHDLYVRAKLLNESSSFNARRLEKLVEAAGLLDQAVARDPDFLLAHCLLANTHGIIYFYGLDHTPARVALAEAAVNAASRLRPDAGETYLARADVLYRCYLDYDRARPELALAQRALPNNAQVLALRSFIDRRQSRWQEAVQGLERALELDPRNWYYLQQISLSYHFLRRYADETAALDRVIAILPDDVISKVARAWVEMEWKADTLPLANTIDAILKQSPAAGTTFTQYYIGLGLYQRDAKTAENAVAAMPAQGLGLDQVPLPVSFWKGLVARMEGDSAAAQTAFLTARAEIERIVRDQPDYASGVCTLALIDAGLGRKQEAIEEGRRACELLPIAKDSINGIHMMEFLAVVYAWTGEKDQAIEQLRATLPYPGIISYGQLKLHPFWDPLRGDPRFEQMAVFLAPKSAGK